MKNINNFLLNHRFVFQDPASEAPKVETPKTEKPDKFGEYLDSQPPLEDVLEKSREKTDETKAEGEKTYKGELARLERDAIRSNPFLRDKLAKFKERQARLADFQKEVADAKGPEKGLLSEMAKGKGAGEPVPMPGYGPKKQPASAIQQYAEKWGKSVEKTEKLVATMDKATSLQTESLAILDKDNVVNYMQTQKTNLSTDLHNAILDLNEGLISKGKIKKMLSLNKKINRRLTKIDNMITKATTESKPDEDLSTVMKRAGKATLKAVILKRDIDRWTKKLG